MSLVGAGGNGSIFLSHLCRIHQAWVKLGGTPFDIHVFDDDTVSEANLARQVFCEADVGQPKAEVLAQRCRAFFGIPVEAHIFKFNGVRQSDDGGESMIVGCVDNLAARRQFQTYAHRNYWLDLGNGASSGQVILGGHGLPTFFDLFPELKEAKEDTSEPSCSMAEALERQDLFINSTVATLGAHLLWTLMRKGVLTHHGYYVNLSTGRTSPIPVA